MVLAALGWAAPERAVDLDLRDGLALDGLAVPVELDSFLASASALVLAFVFALASTAVFAGVFWTGLAAGFAAEAALVLTLALESTLAFASVFDFDSGLDLPAAVASGLVFAAGLALPGAFPSGFVSGLALALGLAVDFLLAAGFGLGLGLALASNSAEGLAALRDLGMDFADGFEAGRGFVSAIDFSSLLDRAAALPLVAAFALAAVLLSAFAAAVGFPEDAPATGLGFLAAALTSDFFSPVALVDGFGLATALSFAATLARGGAAFLPVFELDFAATCVDGFAALAATVAALLVFLLGRFVFA